MGARRGVVVLAAGLVPLLVVPAAAAVGGGPHAAPAAARRLLPGSAPSWAAFTATPSLAAPAAPVDVRVFLAPRGGQAALDAAVAAVSVPDNPGYHHFLTPEQYRARFEPDDAALGSVTSWLARNGFRVTGVEGARRYVTASGDADAAGRAFAVHLRNYERGNRAVQAPDSDASVPTDVAGLVTGVTGLDNEPHLVKPNTKPDAAPPKAFVNAKPCSRYYGQVPATYRGNGTTPLPTYQGKRLSYAVCGYVPGQFRSAYGAATTRLTGAGKTIGIVDAYASPTILADANTYARRRSDPAFAAGQFTQSNAQKFTDGSSCGASGWYGEETLDVEAAHGIAPGAGVRYYGATGCADPDLFAAVVRVVDENRVAAVSNSYGVADSDASAGDLSVGSQVYQQAAMQGMSVLFSSGDDGDEVAATGRRQTDTPASNPDVTAVGGTATAIGSSGAMSFQTGWGTRTAKLAADGGSWRPSTYTYGAGGGHSSLFARPSYQNGVVPASEGSGRAVPDVAMDADPTTGMLVGETQLFGSQARYGEYRIGGTSLASPLMAGMVALVGQKRGRLGFLNPSIYAAVRTGSRQFTDVAAVHVGDGNVRPDYTDPSTASGPILYSVRSFGQDSGLSLGKGWDESTGVGTPNATFLNAFGG